MMEWFVVGLENILIVTATESRTIIIIVLTFDSDSGQRRIRRCSVHICSATLSDERKVGRSIRLAVEGSYI